MVVPKMDGLKFKMEHLKMKWMIWGNVGKTILNHPPVITIFIGGTNHSQMGGLLLFYPHYPYSRKPPYRMGPPR